MKTLLTCHPRLLTFEALAKEVARGSRAKRTVLCGNPRPPIKSGVTSTKELMRG
jgi:hypothetical protein